MAELAKIAGLALLAVGFLAVGLASVETPRDAALFAVLVGLGAWWSGGD